MTEDNGKDKEINDPSGKNSGASPEEDIKGDELNREVAESSEKQTSGNSETTPRDKPAEPNDARVAEQTESPKDADNVSENMQAVEDFDLNLLLDIPLEITVELGRAKIQIQELLDLGPGSTIALSKLEGEPVDILANEKLIARGEVVLKNKKYGIRITEITSRMDRIKGLS